MVNGQTDLNTFHEGHIYDVQPNQAHINEHPSMVLIITIYKVDNAWATEDACLLINSATEYIHQRMNVRIFYW